MSPYDLRFSGSYGLIIPDELPSLLSVIYSNIPTLMKGKKNNKYLLVSEY